MTRLNSIAIMTLAALLLSACSLAPVYRKPDVPAPDYKETLPPDLAANWKVAEPSDTLARGEWWTIFDDPKLNELQVAAAQANQTLKAGFAQLQQARAIARVNEADRWPQVEIGAGATRARPSAASLGLPPTADTSPQTLWRAQTFASYEVDLFGRIANAVEAARADSAQAEGLFKSLILALQADVAQTYFALRGLDAEMALLAETVQLRQQTLGLVERREAAGEVAELDVARARTELFVARAEHLALARRRAELEHALAVLLGKAPAELDLAPQPLAFQPIAIPAGLPSTLLERRPDIAAAERAMAAANARIGVARAAYFPRLSLTGLFGFESADLGDLFRTSSRTWALGPLAGTALSLTVFDGGRRRANEAGAMAAFDETVADYRQTVLVAFREVEDNLSGLRYLAGQAQEQSRSVESARRAAELSGKRYRAGYVDYFEVIDAERQVLATRRAVAQIERERAVATVALIRALGGSWAPSGG